jgi:hypothetical protein
MALFFQDPLSGQGALQLRFSASKPGSNCAPRKSVGSEQQKPTLKTLNVFALAFSFWRRQ